MPAAIPVAAMVVGAAASAYSSSAKARQEKHAIETANQQNIAAHTMSPEEKRAFLAEGFNKINEAYADSTELASRNLASRGMGGTSVAAPIANIARSRAKSIGELYANLVKTAMNMRAGTPNALVVPPAPSFGSTLGMNLAQNAGGIISGVGGQALGGQFAKLFG